MPTKTSLTLLAAALLVSACGGGDSSAPSGQQPTRLLTVVANPLPASPSETTQKYQALTQWLYLGYYGRVADPEGLHFWSSRLEQEAAPTQLRDLIEAYGSSAIARLIVDSFADSAEARRLYMGENGAFLDTLYLNLFNRGPDSAGKAFWLEALDTGRLTRPLASLWLMEGAQGPDKQLLQNKFRVAYSFTVALNTPERILASQSRQGQQMLQSMLQNLPSQPMTDAEISTVVNDTLVKLTQPCGVVSC
jgi:hypothetical protein